MTPPGIKRAALLAAAQALNAAAARCFEAATREERHQRAERVVEVEKVVADGESGLAEYVNTPTMLAYAEEELVLAGQAVPDRLR